MAFPSTTVQMKKRIIALILAISVLGLFHHHRQAVSASGGAGGRLAKTGSAPANAGNEPQCPARHNL